MIYWFFATFILSLVLCAIVFESKEEGLAVPLAVFIVLCSALYYSTWQETRTLKREAITKGFASMVITNKTNGKTEFQWKGE